MTAQANAQTRHLPDEVRAVNVGLERFGESVREQGAHAVDVEWRIPAGGDPDRVAALTRLFGQHAPRIDEANAEVVRRLDEGAPSALGVETAADVVPDLDERTLLHPGPPLSWEDFCDPLRRSLRASAVAEGWASDPPAAERLLEAGEIALQPAGDHQTALPMAATLGPSTPVWVVENPSAGNRAYAPINQGPGENQWMGVDSQAAIDRLVWLRDVGGPVLDRVLRSTGPVDVLSLAAQGLQMGDDLHMRVQGATNHFIRHVLGSLVDLHDPRATEVATFLSRNHLFFLTLGMAAGRSLLDWAAEVEGSSIIVNMSRNGTTFAVRLGGARQRAYVAAAPPVGDALYHPGYGPDDGALDIGDSALLELVGLGGAAAAASPAVAGFLGGTLADAAATTREMEQTCVGRSSRFQLPYLDFRGTPIGLDVRKVVELEITPSINTGIIDAAEGRGQVGAGVARAPLEAFQQALLALDAHLGGR